jgi:hypothetical protein
MYPKCPKVLFLKIFSVHQNASSYMQQKEFMCGEPLDSAAPKRSLNAPLIWILIVCSFIITFMFHIFIFFYLSFIVRCDPRTKKQFVDLHVSDIQTTALSLTKN